MAFTQHSMPFSNGSWLKLRSQVVMKSDDSVSSRNVSPSARARIEASPGGARYLRGQDPLSALPYNTSNHDTR